VVWWLIPLVATLAAWVLTRWADRLPGGLPERPAPGSAQDAAQLARLAEALRQPLPGGVGGGADGARRETAAAETTPASHRPAPRRGTAAAGGSIAPGADPA